MQLICDFDGTITLQDVTNLIWDHFIGPSWRDDLLTSYKRGQISHLKIMVDGYTLIRASQRDMLDYVKPQVGLRPGFAELRAQCAKLNCPLTVVSGGLDFYIREFLAPEIPFYSYQTSFGEQCEVHMPPGIPMREGEDLKVSVLKLLKKKHKEEMVLFIGDGRNDFPIAREADQVFAVRGSTLARMCAEQKIPHVEFEDFREICAEINGYSNAKGVV